MQQKIFWFQDGLKLQSPVQHWDAIDMQTKSLVKLIGHPEFEHSIVDPISCANNLFNNLVNKHKDFSVIIDLTQRLQTICKLFFPSVPIVEGFHMSRLRKVTSSRLDGAGFLTSLTTQERNIIMTHFDMEKPLIIDDVGWSGRSAKTTARLFNLNMKDVTFGFLVTNEGIFGENALGASRLLRKENAQVISGMEVHTPNDDGFHLADFTIPLHINQPDIWQMIINIQKLREMNYVNPDQEKIISRQISIILQDHRHEFFPHAIAPNQMDALIAEGNVIGMDIKNIENSMFDINPPNWLMPSLSKRILSEQLETNKEQIFEIILLLRENRIEIENELHSLNRGKER